jgi:hypothetical protein
VTAFQCGTGVNERFHPLWTRRDCEHPEAVKAELLGVDGLRPGRLVGEEFAVERGLRKTGAFDRHGSPVGLKEEKGKVAVPVLISTVQGEDTVRDNAELHLWSDIYSPPKRFWRLVVISPNPYLRASEKADTAGLPAGEFNRHHYIRNQKPMFEEYPADGAVLLAPADLAEAGVELAAEECRPFAPQTIYDVAGATLMIVVSPDV